MQEEVENRTLTLVVSGTKFTGRLMKAAITKYLAHRKEKKLQKQKSRDTPVIPHGKQTVKQLIGQNQGVSNIEITDPSIKEFEKIARKYGVDYAVKKDRSSSPPKYLIFFKGRDADALTAAFTEYTGKKVRKAEKSERPSVLANAFIIITIAFAVSLMMVLALYNLGTDRENRLYLQGRYQGSFINSTSTVFEKLEHNNQIEAVGKEAAMGTSRINDYTLDVYYRDQNALELKGVTDLLGKMPEAENEIIVEQSYLEHLGLPVQLDQTVTLDMPFGKNQTYHVCGIIQSSNASRIYQVIVSDGLYSRYEKANCYDLLVRVKNTENMDSETLKLLINEIAEQSGVPEATIIITLLKLAI